MGVNCAFLFLIREVEISLKNSNYIKTDGQLLICALNNVNVEVIFAGQTDFVGIVKRFDENVIEFEDSNYYLRKNVSLKVAGKAKKIN